jgi:hypothetical protein
VAFFEGGPPAPTEGFWTWRWRAIDSYERARLASTEYCLCDGCLPWQTAGMGARPASAPCSAHSFQSRPTPIGPAVAVGVR